MIRKLSLLFFYYLPPLAWMLIIFIFSSRARFGITHEFVFDFIIFKTLHMIEYGVLFFFLFRAFHMGSKMNKYQALYLAFVAAVLYGAMDELHQQFVPTREGKLRDVLIDTAGVSVVYWYIKKVDLKI